MPRELSRVNDLNVGADEQFERRWRAVQKIVIVLLIAFVLAGASGLFGRGPLSKTTSRGSDGINVQYERFARSKTPAQVVLIVPDRAVHGPTLHVLLPAKLVESFKIEQTSPQPVRVTPQTAGLLLEFQHAPQQDLLVRMAQEPQKAARLADDLVVEEQHIPFHQIVYP
jgi:hypothetical protein